MCDLRGKYKVSSLPLAKPETQAKAKAEDSGINGAMDEGSKGIRNKEYRISK